jgi:very-short-patch-repair endonuclease
MTADTHHASCYRRGRRSAVVDRFEEQLAFEIRASRLPEPVRQHRWATELVNANGKRRQFKADFAWPEFRLLVEVQGGIWRPGGGAHSHPLNLERDIERQQCAALLRWYVFPVTTDDVKSGKAIGLVTRALEALGWRRN